MKLNKNTIIEHFCTKPHSKLYTKNFKDPLRMAQFLEYAFIYIFFILFYWIYKLIMSISINLLRYTEIFGKSIALPVYQLTNFPNFNDR